MSHLVSHNGPVPDPRLEPFNGCFEAWLNEQERDLEELKAMAKAHTEFTRIELTRLECELVGRVMSHYEDYYRVKSEFEKEDVLSMMSPSWRSKFEEAFVWSGGWRPSAAFHLLYSLIGLQLEGGLSELLSGLDTGNLGELSPVQLSKVDELQRQTIEEERDLTETLAAHQESVADSSMVELSHKFTELAQERVGATESLSERVESTLGSKEEKLKEISGKADDLRLRTLRSCGYLKPNPSRPFLDCSG